MRPPLFSLSSLVQFSNACVSGEPIASLWAMRQVNLVCARAVPMSAGMAIAVPLIWTKRRRVIIGECAMGLSSYEAAENARLWKYSNNRAAVPLNPARRRLRRDPRQYLLAWRRLSIEKLGRWGNPDRTQ